MQGVHNMNMRTSESRGNIRRCAWNLSGLRVAAVIFSDSEIRNCHMESLGQEDLLEKRPPHAICWLSQPRYGHSVDVHNVGARHT